MWRAYTVATVSYKYSVWNSIRVETNDDGNHASGIEANFMKFSIVVDGVHLQASKIRIY